MRGDGPRPDGHATAGRAARFVFTNAACLLSAKRGGALVAASALAAAAIHELEHRRVARADLEEPAVRVERLFDLRLERDCLAELERALRREWGAFALMGFESIGEMAAQTGRLVFVATQLQDGRHVAKAALQTVLVDVHGDAERLGREYPTFQSLISAESLRRSRTRGGDTAVLLQITVLEQEERGGGLGSVLRNAALHMLPSDVKYALTTTPLDATGAVPDLNDASTYTPAMRFHARGGARAALLLPRYKAAPADGDAARHGADIVVMRYERDASGTWPATRPVMRLHSMGPLEERLSAATSRLRHLPSARARLEVLRSRGRHVLAGLTHHAA